MNTPRTIAEYLQQLRDALLGADPALIQDALYDAEEHLRAELAEQPERDEASMLAQVVGSYGAPAEVAEIYRDQEIKIQRALRPPTPPRRRSWLGRFFGVGADPRTYGVLFYIALSLVTGSFYFSWVVLGVSLSLGLSILIIGLPFLVLFFGSVRQLSLLEGRMVETMLGVRMPRRPAYASREQPLLKRIGAMFTDGRSWTTLLYMLLMLPLGIAYFCIATSLLATSLALLAAPVATALAGSAFDWLICDGPVLFCHSMGWAMTVPACLVGVLLLFASLHLLRGIGYLHGQLAKHLLVRGTD